MSVRAQKGGKLPMKKGKWYVVAALFAAGGVFFPFAGKISAAAEAHPREKLSAYTTYFNENEGGRCANIRLSASRIDGIALQPFGEFSFNATVGKRTAENGYQTAKIIAGGEFVAGVGGGVCQVSTTLYNAAILAGLEAIEVHAHSLSVGYVPPSRDAMVSSECDLRLFNPHTETVYFSLRVSTGAIQATVEGKDGGYVYSVQSKTLKTLPPPPPIVSAGDRDEVTRYPKDGLESEAYLSTYRNGVLLSVKRLRKDSYAPLCGMQTKKP